MKKILTLLCMVTLITTLLCIPAAAEVEYGDEDYQNFSYQFTTQSNVEEGTAYDTSKIQNQIYGTNSTFTARGGMTWCPTDEAMKTDGVNTDNFWWKLDGDGTMNPAGGISMVLTYTHATDNSVWISAIFSGGVSAIDQEDTNRDGVTITVQKNNEILKRFDSGSNKYEVEEYADGGDNGVELAKGDKIYFIVDGKAHQDYDAANLQVSIMENESWETHTFGNYLDESIEEVTEQGKDGLYYLYSDKVNQGNSFPLDSLDNCIQGSTTSWQGWGGEGWVPATDFDEKYDGKNWFRIDQTGRTLPGADKTAAIKWVVPEDEKYNLSGSVRAGIDIGSLGTENADGQIVSIFVKGENKFYKEATGPAQNYSFQLNDLQLSKDDEIIFIVDQGENYDGLESGHWTILIEASDSEHGLYYGGFVTLTEDYQDAPYPADKPEPEKPEPDKPEPEKPEPNKPEPNKPEPETGKSPSTGVGTPIALLSAIVAVSGFTISNRRIKRKKK